MNRLFWKLLLAFWLALVPLSAALLLEAPSRKYGWLAFGTAIAASFILSLWLSRYLAGATPALRDAFAALSAGRFDTRIHASMGRRSGALADLTRDFDVMAQQLQTSMGTQQRLLAEVSHELRSPLARVHAAIGLAQQNPEKIVDTLARIETESIRLESMLEDILVLARLESPTEFESRGSVDVIELLDSIVSDAQLEASATDRSIRVHADRPCLLDVYPELLQRAFENVVGNALKYTLPQTCVEVSALHRARQLLITVADRGPGVATEAMADIFEPFYRAKNTARSKKGAGLGLAIARNAVLKHGGHIQAANRIGGGLVVTIALPLLDAGASEPATI